MHPIEKLEMHCKFQSRQPLCTPCRHILFDQAVILHDTLNYASGKIQRVGYFYHSETQTIRMKSLSPPATIIGDSMIHLVPKSDVGDLYEHQASDKYQCDSFLAQAEELYTNEITAIEKGDYMAWHGRKRNKLY